MRGGDLVKLSIFNEISELVGKDAAALMVFHRGGASLYIPKKPPKKHPLCELLGGDAAQKLALNFGGIAVPIPRGCQIQTEQRNRLILTDLAAGMSQSQAAYKYQLTTRTIRKIHHSNRNTTQP